MPVLPSPVIFISVLALGLNSARAAPPDASVSYLGQFGQRGAEVGQFSVPTDLHLDSEGYLMIVEWGNSRIQRCTTTGVCSKWGPSLGTKPDRLVIDDSGRVILTEPDFHYIMVCDADENCTRPFGGMGDAPGRFNNPRSIDIDSRGRLVIADRYNDRVQFCDYDGNCTAFGTFNSGPGAVPGEFWEPNGIVTDRKGTVYVGETGDEVITVCNEDGICSERLGIEGDGPGEFKTPLSLGLTSRGDLVVLELSNNRIQVCNRQVECIAYGSFGRENGQFRSPAGIHVDENDRVFVADTDNHRVQILQITYNSPPPEPAFQINAGLNDAWYNPITSGQGFFVSVFPTIQQMFVAWFTYDTERPSEDIEAILGEPGHRWLTAQGPYSADTATLSIYVTEGGVFDATDPPADNDGIADGTLTIEFADCAEGLVTYEMPSPGVSGAIPIQRVRNDSVPLCESLAAQ